MEDIFNFENHESGIMNQEEIKIALILGNEVEGVTPKLLTLTDYDVEIPMHGQKTSLNVSVAAGVAMYALRFVD